MNERVEDKMQNLNLETVHRLEGQVLKKLNDFIDEIVDIDDLLDDMSDENPFFIDDRERSGLRLWVSLDYIDSKGRTFIQRYLKERSDSLSHMEIKLFMDMDYSFVSLCEIVDFVDDYMVVQDVLQNKEFKILEPHMGDILNPGEFLFVRICKIMDYYIFMGDMSYLPESCKTMFMENFLIDYNLRRIDNPNLSVYTYLKKFSIEQIKNYNNSIINILESDEFPNSTFFDELDDFEEYLQNKKDANTIPEDISNLIEFFDNYLSEKNLTLYDLDHFDFKMFFKEAIRDGFIGSKESLNSYISTLKRFMNYLSSRYKDYKNSYKDILEISENRFEYMAKLKNFTTPFNINRSLENKIMGWLNDIAVNLLIDFDRYILYLMDKRPELTLKKNLKRKHLLELSELINDRMGLDSKYANQEDYPLINMFYHIGMKSGITSIEASRLALTSKGTNFIRLRDEEKFVILFTSIWNTSFFHHVTKNNEDLIDSAMKNFTNLTYSLEENKSYEVKYILDKFGNNLDYLLGINEYLKLLGLVRTSFYPAYTWEITKLGKIVFQYLYHKMHNLQYFSVVNLDMYRDNKK